VLVPFGVGGGGLGVPTGGCGSETTGMLGSTAGGLERTGGDGGGITGGVGFGGTGMVVVLCLCRGLSLPAKSAEVKASNGLFCLLALGMAFSNYNRANIVR
jgi:hypothetical protein